MSNITMYGGRLAALVGEWIAQKRALAAWRRHNDSFELPRRRRPESTSVRMMVRCGLAERDGRVKPRANP
jgi:hypothetical protein